MDSPVIEPVAGFPTHVVKLGHGPRKALFIHCTLGHSGAWQGVMSAFTDQMTMTTFDRPGHGRSAPWMGGSDGKALHDLSTEIAGALLDAEGEAVDLIGHSYGATVALRLALERPGKIRTLTLFEPVLFAAVEDRPEFQLVVELNKDVSGLIDAGETHAAAKLFNDATNPDAPFDTMPAKRQDKLAEQIHLVRDESGATMRDVAGMLAPGRLETITQPVLVMESANPPIGIPGVHDALCGRIPDCRRVVVEGTGHMAPITHPERVAAEIASFLKI